MRAWAWASGLPGSRAPGLLDSGLLGSQVPGLLGSWALGFRASGLSGLPNSLRARGRVRARPCASMNVGVRAPELLGFRTLGFRASGRSGLPGSVQLDPNVRLDSLFYSRLRLAVKKNILESLPLFDEHPVLK